MTTSETLQRLLAALPDQDQLEFTKLLEAIYRVRFTGPLVIDFQNGIPRQINLGPPMRLAICHGQPTSLPKRARPGGVDSPKPVSTG